MRTNKNKEVFSVTTTVQKWGNSLGIRIPKRIAENLDIVNGSELELKESKDGLVLKPIRKDPTLEELMAGITKENQHEEIDWGNPEGNEVW